MYLLSAMIALVAAVVPAQEEAVQECENQEIVLLDDSESEAVVYEDSECSEEIVFEDSNEMEEVLAFDED